MKNSRLTLPQFPRFVVGAIFTLAFAVIPALSQNSVPPTAREAATLPAIGFPVDNGSGGDICLQPGGGLNVIHTFTPTEMASNHRGSSLAINRAGNLYATSTGGDYSQGLISELAQQGQDWVFTRLYSFTGGNGGYSPWLGKLGPDGVLYGEAGGGVNGDGLIFSLRPSPTTCLSTSCGWTEAVVHSFGGNSDGVYPEGLAVDSAGNLYGTTYEGGAYGQGVVYELTPSNGSWTEKILYTFTGQSDGGYPGSLLVGIDGNLYGIASGGTYGYGLVYELLASGGTWTQQIIHTFAGQNDGAYPESLRQDRYGNLYGTTSVHYSWGYLAEGIFMLSPSNGGWVLTQIWSTPYQYEYIGGLIVDVEGDLYGVASNSGEVPVGEAVFQVFKRTQDGQFQNWVRAGNFPAEFGVLVDTAGILYGTADVCGTYQLGVVWQFTGFPDFSP